jgi:hypothetical protein
MKDIEKTIISQYQQSPKLLAIIEAMNEYLDPAGSFYEFYAKVFSIETATDWGLDNIGRIIGLNRTIQLEDGQIYTMADDEEYRYFLKLKAASNITDCSLPSLNILLKKVFADRGSIYVKEKAPMIIKYIFEFELTVRERALLEGSGIIPRPAGVGFGIAENPPNFFFGFWVEGMAIYEQPYRGFNQPDGSGVFYSLENE